MVFSVFTSPHPRAFSPPSERTALSPTLSSPLPLPPFGPTSESKGLRWHPRRAPAVARGSRRGAPRPGRLPAPLVNPRFRRVRISPRLARVRGHRRRQAEPRLGDGAPHRRRGGIRLVEPGRARVGTHPRSRARESPPRVGARRPSSRRRAGRSRAHGGGGSAAQAHSHANASSVSTGAMARKGPSGPRRAGEGVEEEEQTVVDSEWLPGGGLQLRVTLLAAGFVIGASGASVREITQHTGAMIQSWTQQPQPGRYHRPTRVFRVTGPRKSVAAASEIVHQAVERYKELCEGKRRGEFVQRQQRIRGVEFSYQPPPRSAAPQAAALGGGRPPQQHHAGGGGGAGAPALFGAPFGAPRWRTSDTWAPFRRAWAVDITWAARGAWTRRDWRCSPRAAGLFRRRRDRRRADRPSRATTPRAARRSASRRGRTRRLSPPRRPRRPRRPRSSSGDDWRSASTTVRRRCPRS